MTLLEQVTIVSNPSTTQRRFPLFLISFSIILAASPILLWVLGVFSIRTYFIVAFIWLLISSEVFAPAESEIVWWSRLQWVKAICWLILAFLVYERVVVALG